MRCLEVVFATDAAATDALNRFFTVYHIESGVSVRISRWLRHDNVLRFIGEDIELGKATAQLLQMMRAPEIRWTDIRMLDI